jgi:DNA-binding transcriptional MerR regulator
MASARGAQLSIGELAERTGVPATALRYYDQLGLVRPAGRESGRRRYDESAVAEVGVILFLRDVGFTLDEVAQLLRRQASGAGWPELVERKLAELAEREERLRAARTALEHARRCPAGDPSRCPRFWSIIDARMSGLSLEESHRASG